MCLTFVNLVHHHKLSTSLYLEFTTLSTMLSDPVTQTQTMQIVLIKRWEGKKNELPILI